MCGDSGGVKFNSRVDLQLSPQASDPWHNNETMCSEALLPKFKSQIYPLVMIYQIKALVMLPSNSICNEFPSYFIRNEDLYRDHYILFTTIFPRSSITPLT